MKYKSLILTNITIFRNFMRQKKHIGHLENDHKKPKIKK